MKAAIITEDQIKAIEELLDRVVMASPPALIDEALAIVKSLKVQEPVAWFDYDSSAQLWVQVYPNTYGKPLYAGEQP